MATDKKLSSLVINTLTQAQYDSATKSEDELYLTPDDTEEQLANKQDKLVSGTNIKTINNQSILGEGNITIEGGSGGDEDCAKKSEDNTFSGTNTFSKPILADEVDNTLGNSMLRYKSTESNTPIVAGSSEKPLVLMGSGTRPSYSSSGSDFTGSDLALKSDVNECAYGMHRVSFTFTDTTDSDKGIVFYLFMPYGVLNQMKQMIMSLTSTTTWENAVAAIKIHWSALTSDLRISYFLTLLGQAVNAGTAIMNVEYPPFGIYDATTLLPAIIFPKYVGSSPIYYAYIIYPETYTSNTPSGFKWIDATTYASECDTLSSIMIDD